MAIEDHHKADASDLTTEYLARAEKGRMKTSTQIEKVFDACDQLKGIAESRTYLVTPDQWQRMFDTMRKEIDDVELLVSRQQEKASRRARGGRRFEW